MHVSSTTSVAVTKRPMSRTDKELTSRGIVLHPRNGPPVMSYLGQVVSSTRERVRLTV